MFARKTKLSVFQTMIDWNWLWVAGEAGICYGFYYWWRSQDQFLAILEIAPDIDLDELKKFSSSTTSIDYAAVHGLVRPIDSKANSVLTSQFLPQTKGVLQRITLREQKLEKLRNIWTETKNTISDITRQVPLRLVSPSGSSIRVEKPLAFDSVTSELEVIHVKFEPNTTSPVDTLVHTFLGNLSTGLETKERMLLIDVPLTGVGRLEKRTGGNWHLIPHEKWGGILTRSSRIEIVAEHRSKSTIARVFTYLFAVGAITTAFVLLYRYYSRRRRLLGNRLPHNLPPVNPTNNSTQDGNARLQCVICLENEVVYSLQPCSHLGLCHSCAQQLQTRNHDQELCPLCRTPIEQYQRVFLP